MEAREEEATDRTQNSVTVEEQTTSSLPCDPGLEGRPTKRMRHEEDQGRGQTGSEKAPSDVVPRPRVKGAAPIKEEYLIKLPGQEGLAKANVDDDAAEGRGERDSRASNSDRGERNDKGRRQKKKGQNKEREFGRFADSISLCRSVAFSPEFSPRECAYGDRCNFSHDLRKYLSDGRRGDLETFEGQCPVWKQYGRCPSGWRCRFVSSHMKEFEHPDGRKELVLLEGSTEGSAYSGDDEDSMPGVVNVVSKEEKINLNKKRTNLEKSDELIAWLDADAKLQQKHHKQRQEKDEEASSWEDYRAQYVEPPFKPSEKRRIYFGRETPVLAPLTTQGNLPFRRLCVELGAQATYSEMALGVPLIQGYKPDWALMKAHEIETTPPRFSPGPSVVADYDNSRDLKFGAQISANQPWVAVKATEVLARLVPYLRVVDLNCGCPIDMVFKTGAGSALLDHQTKLDRMVRGMNAVSGEIPVTVKIRMGVKDGKPTAQKLIERLAFGIPGFRDLQGPSGCAAVTLHGRSRQQRYARAADWEYIAECAALIKSYSETKDDLTDTIREPEDGASANTRDGRMYFLGNGDCFSHVDYFNHLDNAKVDSVMIGRGALIKPWIFEEIEKGQYLDKSASERLVYVEKFVRYGLEAWGSDELGMGFTRRFLLEFLSFAYRYVPLGILEHLPPNLNDRPPAFRGRNDLETLLASDNYKDWIKISEMFLGPAHPEFKFQPKHKANSYDTIDAEG